MYKCIHCEIEKVIDNHKWEGSLSNLKKKYIITKDLIQVLRELWLYKNFTE